MQQLMQPAKEHKYLVDARTLTEKISSIGFVPAATTPAGLMLRSRHSSPAAK
jgi:hypothetical protein